MEEGPAAGVPDRGWRDLFDSLGDSLNRAAIEAQEMILSAPDPAVADELRVVRRRSLDSMDDLRAARAAIERARVRESGLFAGLRALARRFSETSGIYADLRLPRLEPSPTSDVAWAIYSVADEAFEGLIRRSRATGVVLTLVGCQGELRFTIRDDGVGLAARQGFGWRASPLASLRAISRTLEALGGRAQVSANIRPRGLLLRAEVPAEASGFMDKSSSTAGGLNPAQNE